MLSSYLRWGIYLYIKLYSVCVCVCVSQKFAVALGGLSLSPQGSPSEGQLVGPQEVLYWVRKKEDNLKIKLNTEKDHPKNEDDSQNKNDANNKDNPKNEEEPKMNKMRSKDLTVLES